MNSRTINGVFLLLFTGVALLDAWQKRWVCDDAFISFRYAEHLANGWGLVYNPHEYVEGYSNFLWTVLLSGGSLLQIDLPLFSIVLSLIAFLVFLMGGARGNESVDWFTFLGCCALLHLRIFATSGLETALFLAVEIWFCRALLQGASLGIFVGGVLLPLIRPEGGLFWLASLFFLPRQKVAYSLGILSIYGLWKLYYFGDLLPNTFYAKATEPQWAQGLLYLNLFFSMYWALIPLILSPFIMLYKGSKSARTLSIIWLILALHCARIGGDFMFARFALPLCPLMLILSSEWMRRWSISKVADYGIAALLGLGLWSAQLPSGLTELDSEGMGISGITEERYWYPIEWQQKAQEQGEALRKQLGGIEYSAVIYGAQAMFAYYAQIPYALEGMAGLTDHELARKEARSNRVAHARKADVPYLQDRGIDLYIDFRIKQGTQQFNRIQLDGSLNAYWMIYRADLADQLRGRGAQFVDFQRFLDDYQSKEHGLEELKIDYQQFKRYYFNHNDDEQRKLWFEQRILEE
ncbi:MAG: hypothetical protein CMK59_04110 [Proteobacteria bacterium]|nr:hypothetical protein [Pseudomonadota bacterium]